MKKQKVVNKKRNLKNKKVDIKNSSKKKLNEKKSGPIKDNNLPLIKGKIVNNLIESNEISIEDFLTPRVKQKNIENLSSQISIEKGSLDKKINYNSFLEEFKSKDLINSHLNESRNNYNSLTSDNTNYLNNNQLKGFDSNLSDYEENKYNSSEQKEESIFSDKQDKFDFENLRFNKKTSDYESNTNSINLKKSKQGF